VAVGAGMAVGVVWLLAVTLYAATHPYNLKQFSATEWNACRRQGVRLRPTRSMVGDLRSRYLLRGVERGTIRQLLGEPDPAGALSERPIGSDAALRSAASFDAYEIGPDAWGIDSEWLVVGYDAHGRVTGSWVTQT
jgi:hypothetical protein